MDLTAKNKIKIELEKKYYSLFKDEKKFMQQDLDKILSSFVCASKSNEKDLKKSLIEQKKQAIDCLDIKKIKTLNFEINNVD